MNFLIILLRQEDNTKQEVIALYVLGFLYGSTTVVRA